MAWRRAQGESKGSERGVVIFDHILTLKCRKATGHLLIHSCYDVPGTVLVLGCWVSQGQCGPGLQRVYIQGEGRKWQGLTK